MPKVKIARKSTLIDMTAMTDVAFLLLTFFMLTARMRPSEPIIVDTPSSISEIKLPEIDIMTITIDKTGRVYFNADGQFKRRALIDRIDERLAMGLSEEEKVSFANSGGFGVPFKYMKSYLSTPPGERALLMQPGIPSDSTANELGTWVREARVAGGNKYRIVIKADQDTRYPDVRKVINTLQAQDINKFNLITDLETNPGKLNPLAGN